MRPHGLKESPCATGPHGISRRRPRVPRGLDLVAMPHSPAVCLLGCPGIDRHVDTGLPSANLADLVSLAKAPTVLGVVVAAEPVG